MPSFNIGPSRQSTPETDTGFPRFIQFQQDGVNLGGPDVDTVNFVSPLIAVRGVSGTDEKTLTVTTE